MKYHVHDFINGCLSDHIVEDLEYWSDARVEVDRILEDYREQNPGVKIDRISDNLWELTFSDTSARLISIEEDLGSECPLCLGEGQIAHLSPFRGAMYYETCEECGGTGETEEES